MNGSKINNKNLAALFGTFISKDGYDDFIAFPARKESLKKNWADQNGQQVDLANPYFEPRRFKLSCMLRALGATAAEKKENFWNQYNALFTELSLPGSIDLYIEPLGKTFTVFYVDQSGIDKKGIEAKRMFITFDLIFEETDPSVNIPKVFLVDENDNFLIA